MNWPETRSLCVWKQLTVSVFSFIFCLLSSDIFSQAFTINTTVVNVSCPGGSDGSISVSVSGGTSPYAYNWNDNQTTSAVTGLSAGTYTVTITDSDTPQNDSTISVSVTAPQPISDNADIQAPFCTSNGHVVLIPSGGTSPYQFSWNTGQTVAGITSVGAGEYSVIVTDANSCTANFSYSLTETECFVTPSSYFTPNGDSYNDTWQIANAQYFDNAHLIVFDRWGTRVHEQKGTYELWEGKSYLGIPVPDAVYYYFFYQDKDDKQKNAKSGSVTIIR